MIGDQAGGYERSIRSYIRVEEGGLRLCFDHAAKEKVYERIFFKDTSTDFNNGLFKCMTGSPQTLTVMINRVKNRKDDADPR